MVESDGIRKAAEDELQKLMGRVNKHQEYYLSNSMISSTFNFLNRDFAFKKKSPILPIIYETKRGIKIRNKNYSFFMYKQSKRTPFRV